VTTELRIVLERLVYLDEIKRHVLSAFAPTHNTRARLRHRDITKHVAECMGREFSPALGRDAYLAMKAHGWRSIRHARVAFWKGVDRR